MPQFDIFSFFSQLFWVFLGFLTFYLLICFYLLPSIAAILKIRKRKIAQIFSGTGATTVVSTNSTLTLKALKDGIFVNLNSAGIPSDTTISSNLTKSLNLLTVKTGFLRSFNLLIFTRAHIPFLLYV
jgi:hypothetical protein